MPPSVEYGFYAEEYGGSAIGREEWPARSREARGYLRRLCSTARVTPYGADSWPMAVCAVADAMADLDAAERKAAVSSASIGSVSTSWDATRGGSIDLSPSGRERALLDAAKAHLHVYAGVL